MADLRVEVGGLRLKNPLMLASCAISASAAGMRRHIRGGFAAVVVKTTTRTALAGAPAPTVFWYDPEEKRLLSGVEGLKNPGIERMVAAIEEVAALAGEQDCKIIGSCTGNTAEETAALCRRLAAAGASAVELNMVCPNTGPHLGPEYATIGRWWAEEAERAVSFLQAVRREVDIPIWAKLPLAKLVERRFLEAVDREGEPQAICYVGGRLPNLKIDVASGRPLLPGNLQVMIEQGVAISPMVTGTVKPSTILHTAYLAKQVDRPLVCSGDLTRGEDVLEAVMAGAAAAQICKAVYRESGAGRRVLDELEQLMERHRYPSLRELRGRALAHLPDPPLLTVPGARWG